MQNEVHTCTLISDWVSNCYLNLIPLSQNRIDAHLTYLISQVGMPFTIWCPVCNNTVQNTFIIKDAFLSNQICFCIPMRRIWSLVLLLPNETLGTQALLQLHIFISKTVTYSIGSFHVCFSCGLGSSRSPSTAYGGQLLRRREVVSTRSFCNSCPLFMVGIWRDDIFQGKWDSNRIWPRMNFLPKSKVVDVSAKRTSFCLPLESGLGKYVGLFWIETEFWHDPGRHCQAWHLLWRCVH